MKTFIFVIALLLNAVAVNAEQSVTISWIPGQCADAFRIYRSTPIGWIEIAETQETSFRMVIPDYQLGWRVSGICLSGPNEGEWWLEQGVWTGRAAFEDVKRG